jgi:hypothetical protein
MHLALPPLPVYATMELCFGTKLILLYILTSPPKVADVNNLDVTLAEILQHKRGKD